MNHQLQTQQAFVKFHYETNQFPARHLIDRTSNANEPCQSIKFNKKKAYFTLQDSLSNVTCISSIIYQNALDEKFCSTAVYENSAY